MLKETARTFRAGSLGLRQETTRRCTKNKNASTDRSLIRTSSCDEITSDKNSKKVIYLFGTPISIDTNRNSDEETLGTENHDNGNHGSVAIHCSLDGSPSVSDARKKGKPWTKEEHQLFLVGLEKLGKGSWKAIAENYVCTRTPVQVASHAQKYFLKFAASDKKRNRRPSIFDTPLQQPAVRDVSGNQHGRHTMASCSSVMLPSSSSGPVASNFTRQGLLNMAQARWLAAAMKASCSMAQPDRRAALLASFEYLELRLLQTNDDRSNLSQSSPGAIRIV